MIRALGNIPITRRLGTREYKAALRDKLLEEVEEFRNARGKHAQLEELADIQEVLLALYAAEKIECADVTRLGSKKRRLRGGFTKQVFLERVEVRKKKQVA